MCQDSCDAERSRLEALESTVAHQERMIEELNAALVSQWTEIDRLGRLLGAMADRLAETEHRMGPPVEAKPPHY